MEVRLEKGCDGGLVDGGLVDWWREFDKKAGCLNWAIVVQMMESLGSGLSSVFLEVFSSEMYFSKGYFKNVFFKSICFKGVVFQMCTFQKWMWSSWELMMEGLGSSLSRVFFKCISQKCICQNCCFQKWSSWEGRMMEGPGSGLSSVFF